MHICLHKITKDRAKKIMLFVTMNSAFPLALAENFVCNTPVESYSNRAKVATGDLSANVIWQQVNLNKNSIGYGPAEHKHYEITIVDGTVYMVQPDGDNEGVIVNTKPNPSEGAFMLQIASPEAWGKFSSLDFADSLTGLSQQIAQKFTDLGCDDKDVMPFKIKGFANSLTWSLDTKVPKVINSSNEEVEIIGVFSKANHKKYFLLNKYNLHPHVLLKNTKGAGHLRTIILKQGAELFLPTKS